jgi:hypothetical protein
MANDHAFDQAEIAARAEIAHVMNCWCRAVDRCDWSGVRDVFHPDGHDDHGLYKGNIDGLISWLQERHRTITRSMHLIGNMLIEFADDANALVETYSFALQRYAADGADTRKAIAGGADLIDEEFDMLISGRYVDHFVKREGRWRILKRHVVFDNSQILPLPKNRAELSNDWFVSIRDRTDPLWALRAKLGIG